MKMDEFDLTVETLKGVRPYRPFTIVLMNGDRYEIDHPGAISIREGFAIYIAPGKVPIYFNHDGVNQIIGDLIEAGRELSK